MGVLVKRNIHLLCRLGLNIALLDKLNLTFQNRNRQEHLSIHQYLTPHSLLW